MEIGPVMMGLGSWGLSPSSSPHAGLVPLKALGYVEFSLATLPLISNQYIELDINVSVLCGPPHRWGRVG